MKLARASSLILTALLFSPGSSLARAADAKDVFEARVFESTAGKKLNYRVLKPADYSPNAKYPLVLFLHGLGERGDDNVAQLVHGMNDFATDANREKFPAFVVAPQCPKTDIWADFRRPADAPEGDLTDSLKLVAELLDALPREYSIDPRRVYLTGLSMGGFGSWDLLRHHPDRFAAAAIICGGGSERQAARFAKVPIWVFHGDQDELVKPDVSRRMVAALRRAGGRPLYTEFVGVGHESWKPAYADPLLMTWLFAQERSAAPVPTRAADAKDTFEARVFENGAGKSLNYRLLRPVRYDSTQKYPLVLYLHGGFERGDDNKGQLTHGMNDFASDENREKHPCFVVAPQCPATDFWVDFQRKPGDPDTGPTEALKCVINLLDALPSEFSIDERRLYVTGISMGGFGLWELLQRFPQKFAAAAPFCSTWNEGQAEKFVKTPLWVFHGEKDELIKPELGRRLVAAIRNAGGRPLYTELTGVGHESWKPVYRDPLFMTWLFAQERAE